LYSGRSPICKISKAEIGGRQFAQRHGQLVVEGFLAQAADDDGDPDLGHG
jgi:hypothetical protein